MKTHGVGLGVVAVSSGTFLRGGGSATYKSPSHNADHAAVKVHKTIVFVI